MKNEEGETEKDCDVWMDRRLYNKSEENKQTENP